jgi:hypothetical protein
MAFALLSKPAAAARAKTPGRGAQPALRVSQPHERFEREADRSASHVMRSSSRGAGSSSHPAISTLPEATVPRADGGAPGLAGSSASPHADAQALRWTGPRDAGQPLPQALRRDFERRFGRDFSGVRVHPDAGADAGAIRARAFTVGSDIMFGPGAYAPGTRAGRRLLAHELTHVVQQRNAAAPGIVFRTPTAYKDCSEATTLEKNWKATVEKALERARDFADVAIAALNRDPAKERKGSAYPPALSRHFLGLDAEQRATVRANFIKLRDELKPEKIRCAKTEADLDVCFSEKGLAGAFMQDAQDFLCPAFWSFISRNCMAMCLIHEAAHIIGLGMGDPHPPYRGGDEYPFGSKAPKDGETTAARMDNPDAYSYFAAHIWREMDSTCAVRAELIIITSPPPTGPSTAPEGDK